MTRSAYNAMHDMRYRQATYDTRSTVRNIVKYIPVNCSIINKIKLQRFMI